jgi:hypothetical protein
MGETQTSASQLTLQGAAVTNNIFESSADWNQASGTLILSLKSDILKGIYTHTYTHTHTHTHITYIHKVYTYIYDKGRYVKSADSLSFPLPLLLPLSLISGCEDHVLKFDVKNIAAERDGSTAVPISTGSPSVILADSSITVENQFLAVDVLTFTVATVATSDNDPCAANVVTISFVPVYTIYKAAFCAPKITLHGLSGTKQGDGTGPVVLGTPDFGAVTQWSGDSITVELLQDLLLGTTYTFSFQVTNDHTAQQALVDSVRIEASAVTIPAGSDGLSGTILEIIQAQWTTKTAQQVYAHTHTLTNMHTHTHIFVPKQARVQLAGGHYLSIHACR